MRKLGKRQQELLDKMFNNLWIIKKITDDYGVDLSSKPCLEDRSGDNTYEDVSPAIIMSLEYREVIKEIRALFFSVPLIMPYKAHSEKMVWETIYREALKAGLPEIEGYYGFDSKTNEFIKP